MVLGASACGLAGAPGGPSGAGGVQRDRIVIGGFGDVVAVAASQRMVFVASPSGLATYDRLAQQWLPPLTPADGYPADRVTALAGDPETEGVWIGTIGEVLFYRPGIDQLIRTIVGMRVDRIVFDRADPSAGAYVGSAASGVGSGGGFGRPPGVGAGVRVQPGDQWIRVSHAGFASRLGIDDLPPPERWVVPPDLESLSERFPALASFAELLTRDEALRSWRPTSAAQIPGMSEVWLGTRGGGLFLADPLFNRARPMPFGLFEPGVSALAVASDGVWAASIGAEPRGTGGVTFASADLQQWRWLRGPADGSFAGMPIRDLLVRDGTVWVATERGVAHRSIRGGATSIASSDWQWIAGSGQRRAHALAVLDAEVWAGTDDGLLLAGAVNGSGMPTQSSNASIGVVRPTGMGAIRALLATGDTLWIGAAAGLGMMRVVGGVPAVTPRPLSNAPVWLQAPIVRLARSDTVAVVMTDQRLGIVDLRTRSVSTLPGDPDLSRLGPLMSLAVDGRTIWIGGDRGAVVVDRASGLVRNVGVPGTMAERVFDIALHPEFAWLATPTGLVRVRRLPDGGVH